MITETETIEPFALSPSQAAHLLNINRSTFYRKIMPLVRTGKISSLKIGSARRILWHSLKLWIEQAAAEEAVSG